MEEVAYLYLRAGCCPSPFKFCLFQILRRVVLHLGLYGGLGKPADDDCDHDRP